MPTYDYECTKCGYTFEVFQKVDEEPRKRCPKCRSKVKRLISGGCGIIFKGSGFYATDYKNKTSSGKKHENSKKEDSPKSNSNKETTNKT